jgi:hypothetical protein
MQTRLYVRTLTGIKSFRVRACSPAKTTEFLPSREGYSLKHRGSGLSRSNVSCTWGQSHKEFKTA